MAVDFLFMTKSPRKTWGSNSGPLPNELVEKHRLLAKEAGGLLDEKVDSDFIDLISKRYDTKKKYSNLS